MSVFTLLICALIYIISKENAKVYSSASVVLSATKESNLSILLTTGTDLMWFSPRSHSRTVIVTNLLKANHVAFGNCGADESSVFWADGVEKKIYRKIFGNNEEESNFVVVSRGIGTIQGLTLDWIDGNLYWVDGQYSRIEVSKLDGSMRTTVLEGVDHTLGLEIDPVQGLLFWTSQKHGKEIIERSNLDGSNKKEVFPFNVEFDSISVGALSVDIFEQKLYWIDSKSKTLQQSNYDGNSHVIIGKNNRLGSAISLASFKKRFYWVESDHYLLISAPIEDINRTETLTMTHPALYDIELFDAGFDKPDKPNKRAVSCLVNGCSHLCLRGEGSTASCFCPYSLQLSSDRKTCQKHGSVLGFANKQDQYHNVFFVDLDNPHSWIFPPLQIPVQNVVGFAADPLKDALFWIDDKKIQTQLLTGETRTVIELDYFSPSSLALDWKSRNLYLLSAREFDQSVISICKDNGNFFTQLVWQDMHIPKQLVVDPENRLLFWLHYKETESDELYILDSSSLDGSNRKNALTSKEIIQSFVADSVSKQLCWLIEEQDSIICQKYFDGQQHILKSTQSHITVMCSYNGNLLYADQRGSINGVNITLGQQNSVAVNTSHTLCFLTVMDPKYSTANYYSVTENLPDSLCIEKKAQEYKCQYEKAYPYLFYTSFEEPHGLSLNDSLGPDTFPGKLFSVSSGDTVDIFMDNSEVYFWINNGKTLMSVTKAINREHVILISDDELRAIAIDTGAGNIYWSIPTKGEIWVARLDGRLPYIVLSDINIHATALAINSRHGLLIWANFQMNGTYSIKCSTLSGKNTETLYSEILSIGDLATVDNMIYWTNPKLGIIEKIVLKDRTHEVVLGQHMFDSFEPNSLAVHDDDIYWTDSLYLNGSVLMKSLHEDKFSLVKKVSNPGKILVVKESVPNVQNPCHVNNGGCQDLCLYNGQSDDFCFCSYGYVVNSTRCQNFSSFLVVANGNKISSVKLENAQDPNPPVPEIYPGGNFTNFAALAYDPFRERIYFSLLYHKPHLFSIFPNGTGLIAELKEIQHLRLIEGMVFDTTSKTLLWTDVSRPSIWTLKHGIEKASFVLPYGEKPRGIAIHACTGRVFWTNYKKRSPRIEIGWLGTSQFKSFISDGLTRPEAIAVHNDMLFWSDIGSDGSYSISSTPLDNVNRKRLISGTHGVPFSLVPFNDSIIWTDRENGNVCQSVLSESISCLVLRRNFHNPLGLTLIKQPEPAVCQDVDNRNLLDSDMGSTSTILSEYNVSCEGDNCSNMIKDNNHATLKWKIIYCLVPLFTIIVGVGAVYYLWRKVFGRQVNLIKLTRQLLKQNRVKCQSVSSIDSSQQVILQRAKVNHSFEMDDGISNCIQLEEGESLILS